jgi:putative DNA methylase
MRKKLIEVALPLEAINQAAAREKSIRHGHPSTLHLWWARRPLAAARAVIFAQMVDDPSGYVDTLKADAKLRREAERVLKAKHKLWEQARATFEKAEAAGIAAPNPGPEPTLEEILAERERERLFEIIKKLVVWENTTNEGVLQEARDEIWQSWRRACAANVEHPRAKELFDRHKLPAFHDPFAGGGALPLEAQRLGLESYASDLNPVAVLINKAMIEIPPKFAGRPPVNPQARGDKALFDRQWRGARGLAEDVRYYGRWMRDEAEKRIGHLYPKVKVVREADGSYRHATPAEIDSAPRTPHSAPQELTVIAWLWARTVKSPNPAFADVDVPLASTFMLSTKPGKEAWVEPVIERGGYRFTVKTGKPLTAEAAEAAKSGTKLARGANFRCVMSGTPIQGDYIKAEGKAGRMGARLMAIVAEGERGRIYLAPTPEHEAAARKARPEWVPEQLMPIDRRWFSPPLYGMPSYGDLFTPRQLVALTTFSDLVGEAMERIRHDALAAGLPDDGKPLRDGGVSATAYAEAVAVYLAIGISRLSDAQNSLCQWGPSADQTQHLFRRQAVPMVWDYAESSIFSEAAGDLVTSLGSMCRVLDRLATEPASISCHSDAQNQSLSEGRVISTDPPYYDNIGYADLSDFFYVWLRRSLRSISPDLFATLAVPKAEELVATPYRHGGKEWAEKFFLDGMTQAMRRLAEQAHPAFPVTIYYAFKQTENESDTGTASTGWETFLDAVIRAGFAISGTWPMRTERGARSIGIGTNALASSIILVCRQRTADAKPATRREFVAALKRELPDALRLLQAGNIAPVDLAQAAIGPGMGVFTRYAGVLDAEGRPMTVREALALINQTLDEALAEQEGDFDADSRWALAWFEQHGFAEGEYGVAEILSKAKNTSVQGLAEAGILASSRGRVRLLKPEELPADWNPAADARLTAWESVHHLIRVLGSGGEAAAAALLAELGAGAEVARELAYRLYTVCERKKRAAEALAYNGLVQSWPEIVRLAQENRAATPTQEGLFGV